MRVVPQRGSYAAAFACVPVLSFGGLALWRDEPPLATVPNRKTRYQAERTKPLAEAPLVFVAPVR
jgi:hypothetical protein